MKRPPADPDLASVWGQEPAKRALEVAAAGGHSLLLLGPTGAGKSLLARCLPGLLPPLAPGEAEEVAALWRDAGEPAPSGRPVRCPGADLPAAALFPGEGRRPGEIQLARHGVLILDDLARLRRAARRALYPLLDRWPQAPPCLVVAALRPCPCGGLARPDLACGCPPAEVRRHLARLDGALLDRFDLHTEVSVLSRRELMASGEPSAAVAARVAAAHRFRAGRLRTEPPGIPPDAAGRDLLAAAVERLGFSSRALASAVAVARTIADLAASPEVRPFHLAEAVQYRRAACGEPLRSPAGR